MIVLEKKQIGNSTKMRYSLLFSSKKLNCLRKVLEAFKRYQGPRKAQIKADGFLEQICLLFEQRLFLVRRPGHQFCPEFNVKFFALGLQNQLFCYHLKSRMIVGTEMFPKKKI